jgi:hypothetical protein
MFTLVLIPEHFHKHVHCNFHIIFAPILVFFFFLLVLIYEYIPPLTGLTMII